MSIGICAKHFCKNKKQQGTFVASVMTAPAHHSVHSVPVITKACAITDGIRVAFHLLLIVVAGNNFP